jgi:rhodanese-related sulfurtransferase
MNLIGVIDVNSRQSWMNARVPGAWNLDLAAYTESELSPDKNAVLVFYWKAPNAARRNVNVMSAGISGWLAAKLPTEGGE